MRLPQFILSNTEAILKEWELFGRSLSPGNKLGSLELRDHAMDILTSAVSSMKQSQTDAEQSAKSKGEGGSSSASESVDKASELHGTGRVSSGFNLSEVVAEYRALRASVLKLWKESSPAPNLSDLDDVNRFNESIDQSLTVAVESFTKRVDHSRQMFLAILGHDLRNPLQSIRSAASLLSRPGKVEENSQWIVSQMTITVVAMDKLICDLLDFTGAALGKGPPIIPALMDLGDLGENIIQEMSIAQPAHSFCYKKEGNLLGEWDAGRLQQMISNLLSNAVHHGSDDFPIDLEIMRLASEIRIVVRNHGNPISPNDIGTIFNPLVRGTSVQTKPQLGSIGLGLFIAREVAVSHGGTIKVSSSSDEGTAFVVNLPLRPIE